MIHRSCRKNIKKGTTGLPTDLPQEVLRIEETNEEMHAAIDKLKDRLKNELLRLKEKLADH